MKLMPWLKRSLSSPEHLLRVFQEFQVSLGSIEDLDLVAHHMVGKVAELMEPGPIALALLDRDGTALYLRYGLHLDLPKTPSGFQVTGPLARWLEVNRQPLDLREPDRGDWLEPDFQILCRLAIDICLPIHSARRLIGVLLLGRNPDREPHRLRLLESLCPQMGLALENAFLYREQRERFRRMFRADKLATIGELAAGAAHEIRNPLTAIKSALQFLEPKLQENSHHRVLLNAIDECRRIENTLTGMLTMSRAEARDLKPLDLNSVLESTVSLLDYQARSRQVQLEVVAQTRRLMVEGDRSQLSQVLINILMNALQAVHDGGHVKILVEERQGHAVISVTDDGVGIPEAYLDRVFDPFFTRKKEGTGLGLSICYGLIQRHRGDIEIQSREGEGSTVTISLPLIKEAHP